MSESTRPKKQGERFILHPSRKPNTRPSGSELWPVRDIVGRERLTLHTAQKPRLFSVPDGKTLQLLVSVAAKLAEPEQAVFAEIILSRKTVTETAGKLGLTRGAVYDLFSSALDGAEHELRSSHHDYNTAAVGLRLLAAYRDGLEARAPSFVLGG